MLFEAYVHQNGTIQVKRLLVINGVIMSNIDLDSPFVKEYLGNEEAKDYTEAMEIFKNKIRI